MLPGVRHARPERRIVAEGLTTRTVVWVPARHPADAVAAELLADYRSVMEPSGTAEKPSVDLALVAARVEEAYQAGDEFNPVFDFEAGSPEEFEPLRQLSAHAGAAAALLPDPVLDVFAGFLRREAAMGVAMRTHDADEITRVSTGVHGELPPGLAAHARVVLATLPRDRPAEDVTAEQAAAALTCALGALDADGWVVTADDAMLARMSVSPLRRVVRVKASVLFSADEVVRLAVHEAGVHVARAVHGARQDNPLLALGIGPRHTVAEEGLAVWTEQACGVASADVTRKYAARVLAADAALLTGFAGTYRTVREHLPAGPAFDVVMRAKRGIANTARPGAHVKDKAYLEGLLEATSILGPAHAPTDLSTRRLLWATKGSFTMLPVLTALRDDGRLHVPGHDPLEACHAAGDAARAALA